MNILAHLTCEVCGDTWFRDMDDRELADYMAENPEVNLPHGHGSQRWNVRRFRWHDLRWGVKTFTPMNMNSRKMKKSRRNTLKNLKEDACAAAGTGEFSIWHFNPELGGNE